MSVRTVRIKVYRTTCGNCAAILEYTESDVLRKISSVYYGGIEILHYITCQIVITK
jgi:hypothetical protein